MPQYDLLSCLLQAPRARVVSEACLGFEQVSGISLCQVFDGREEFEEFLIVGNDRLNLSLL